MEEPLTSPIQSAAPTVKPSEVAALTSTPSVKPAGFTQHDKPQPVVKVLSVRGVEYLLFTISLWIVAGGLSTALISLISGDSGFDTLAGPAAILIAGMIPLWLLFTRLKTAELKDPSLCYEPSKRRSSQFSQVFSFIILFITTFILLYNTILTIGGSASELPKTIFSCFVVYIIAGGIFTYYWREEHRFAK